MENNALLNYLFEPSCKPYESKVLHFFDFCAGIGAGRLGLELGGKTKCVGYAEITLSSVETYKLIHNTENERNFGDITKINIDELPYFDIMIAGFPCQSFSVLGFRKGLDDCRGQIIYHLIDILVKKNVPYFILENVKGLINHNNGTTIKIIINALESAGYYTDYKVLNSLHYGVPQLRDRVYFVGIKQNKLTNSLFNWPNEIPTPDLKNYLIDENSAILDLNDPTFQKFINNKYNKGRFDITDLLKNDYLIIDTRQSDLRIYEGKVPTLRAGRHGILYVKNGKLRKLTGYESLLLQGFDKISAKKVASRMPEQRILQQTGNAMTVCVIEQIAMQLIKYINRDKVADA